MPRKHTAGEAEEKRRAEENLTLLKNVDQADRGWLEELFQESSAAPVKQTAIPDSQGEFAEEWDRVFGPEMTSTPSPAVPQAAQAALLQLSPQKSTSGRGGLLPSQLLDWGPPTAATGGNKGDLMNFAAAPAAAGGSMAAGKKVGSFIFVFICNNHRLTVLTVQQRGALLSLTHPNKKHSISLQKSKLFWLC